MKQFNVIIAAPNAATNCGGEAILPVHYFRILRARGFEVDLFTHERNRDDLLSYFPPGTPGLHFIADTRLEKSIWGVGRYLPPLVQAATTSPMLSVCGDLRMARWIRTVISETVPTIVHVPAPVSPKMPSGLFKLGAPVVFGPMNGNMSYPEGYEDNMSLTERLVLPIGRMLSHLANLIIPGKLRAGALLVSNDRTAKALPIRTRPPYHLVENGVDLSIWQSSGSHRPIRTADDPFRLLYVGRLVGWKALDITLDALVKARDLGIDAHLDIVGDGEQRSELSKIVILRGLPEFVVFHGHQLQQRCAQIMAVSDGLILNSLRECGGAVVLEAMASGLPVIASDWGGPADYVTPETGQLVSPTPSDSFAHRLALAIERLARDPDLCREMGAMGLKRVQTEFDWEAKVDTMTDIYRHVLSLPCQSATPALPTAEIS